MQVNETLAEGLKRELKVTIPASELDSKLSDRLDELKTRVQIKGFRPGKVPVNHLRRVYGKSAMAEIVENMVGESTRQALADRGERAAMQPKVELPEDESEAKEILEGRADLIFTLAYEVLPSFDLGDFKGLKIERPVAEIADEEVDERMRRIGESARAYVPVERQAQSGDRARIGFVGKIDGQPFEGGTSENSHIVLGSDSMIPGFEDQLIGLKAGEEKTIEVTFPDDYPAASNLAGKSATFEVKMNEVGEPEDIRLDDEFAKRLGLESVDKLRETIKKQIESEYSQATRQKVKRQMLDQLDERHSFQLPENLVAQEFDNIWHQVMHDVEHHGKKFEDEGTTEEEARKEYRTIAERRVRLGLVLSRIGESAEVAITEEEMQQALMAQLRSQPTQQRQQQALEFFKRNPEALRAPIFEEKVVDYILEFAEIKDKPVSKEELLAEDEDDDDHHDHEHHHHDH